MATWKPAPTPKGSLLCHTAELFGRTVTTELAMDGLGRLQIRVNGQLYDQPFIDCSLAQGRRRYYKALKKLERPKQLTLPT